MADEQDDDQGITPEEEERWIAALKELKHARRTLEADEIERLILNADELDVPIHEHLKHTARTPALIKLLREHPDPFVRLVVCRVFHDTRLRSARQPLLEALFDPDGAVRLEAADAYMKVARREDAPIVLAALELEKSWGLEEAWGVAWFLIGILGYFGFDRAAPALVDLLDNRDLDTYAKSALGRLSPEAVRAAFAQAMEDAPDPEVVARLRGVLDRLSWDQGTASS